MSEKKRRIKGKTKLKFNLKVSKYIVEKMIYKLYETKWKFSFGRKSFL